MNEMGCNNKKSDAAEVDQISREFIQREIDAFSKRELSALSGNPKMAMRCGAYIGWAWGVAAAADEAEEKFVVMQAKAYSEGHAAGRKEVETEGGAEYKSRQEEVTEALRAWITEAEGKAGI
ncbi:MAG: hypothetical protein GY820_39855 [Gammaproteobacteria bacterium]|nr:hypothetical protein [Gammaproteobacteria bacterium]